MIHVFVESNWVVDVCAPTFRRTKEALSLLDLAASRKIALHVPHIALREAQSVIKRKRRVQDLDVLRQFRTWAVLVRAESISDRDARVFCTTDFDLAPVVKNGTQREHLKRVYAAASIEMRTSFNLYDLLAGS